MNAYDEKPLPASEDNDTTPEPTRDQQRRAAVKLIDEGDDEHNVGARMPKRAFASLYEAAFATPSPGAKYDGEAYDLAIWIFESMHTGESDLMLRVLAQPFASCEFVDWASHGHWDSTRPPCPLLKEAYLELIRAVATFRLREQAYYIALGDQEGAA